MVETLVDPLASIRAYCRQQRERPLERREFHLITNFVARVCSMDVKRDKRHRKVLLQLLTHLQAEKLKPDRLVPSLARHAYRETLTQVAEARSRVLTLTNNVRKDA